MAMTAASMKAKVKAKIEASGLVVSEGTFNVLLALCEGIIEEIQANAQVKTGIAVAVSTATGVGATTAPGMIE